MKSVVPENIINTVTATSENVNYPATSLLTDSPKDQYRACDGVVMVRLNAVTDGADIDTVSIIGTNATGAEISVVDPFSMEWGGEYSWGVAEDRAPGDLLVNGGFNYDGSWDIIGDAQISGGNLQFLGTSTEVEATQPPSQSQPNLYYRVIIDVSAHSIGSGGVLNFYLKGNVNLYLDFEVNGPGVYSIYFQLPDRVYWGAGLFSTDSFLGDVDQITFHQVGITFYSWVVFTGAAVSIIIQSSPEMQNIYATIPEYNQAVGLAITLYGNDTIYAGVLHAGKEESSLWGAAYGLTLEPIDYSTERLLENGADYYHKTDIVDTWSGRVMKNYDDNFYRFISELPKKYGRIPMVWKITDADFVEHIIYGRLSTMPIGNYFYPAAGIINFKIKEVL